MISGVKGILVSGMGAPMVIGKGQNNISVSSDVLPFYGACSEVSYMRDGDNFFLDEDGIHALEDNEIPESEILEGVYDEEDPGNFPHMMMKEIHDQPTALSNVLSGRITPDGLRAELSGFSLPPDEIRKLDRINIVACGRPTMHRRLSHHISVILRIYARRHLSQANFQQSLFVPQEP